MTDPTQLQTHTHVFGGRPTQMLQLGQGPVAVLIHGSADKPTTWLPVMQALAGQFQLLAPGLPPIAVEEPAGGRRALDLDLPWLDEVLTLSGARILAAHSYGALLALRWALAHPGRLDRLVLIEPICWGMVAGHGTAGQKLDELRDLCLHAFARGEVESAMHWLVDYWNGQGFFARLPERIRAGLVTHYGRTWAEVASGGGDQTSAAEVRTLTMEVQLLAGEHTTPESLAVMRALAAALPRAPFQVLPGATHQCLKSHAARVAAAIAGTTQL
ncbi:MAG: alpha/beta hydrolase [Deltaproteobacteria bacterium]|nr:alpha/beta hydrolase [Deltaproteobacteria bacterium]